jgi:hypothetical protein
VARSAIAVDFMSSWASGNIQACNESSGRRHYPVHNAAHPRFRPSKIAEVGAVSYQTLRALRLIEFEPNPFYTAGHFAGRVVWAMRLMTILAIAGVIYALVS